MIGERTVREYRRITLAGLAVTVVVWVALAGVVAGLLVRGWW